MAVLWEHPQAPIAHVLGKSNVALQHSAVETVPPWRIIDHCDGIALATRILAGAVGLAALALGATIVVRVFTLRRRS